MIKYALTCVKCISVITMSFRIDEKRVENILSNLILDFASDVPSCKCVDPNAQCVDDDNDSVDGPVCKCMEGYEDSDEEDDNVVCVAKTPDDQESPCVCSDPNAECVVDSGENGDCKCTEGFEDNDEDDDELKCVRGVCFILVFYKLFYRMICVLNGAC